MASVMAMQTVVLLSVLVVLVLTLFPAVVLRLAFLTHVFDGLRGPRVSTSRPAVAVADGQLTADVSNLTALIDGLNYEAMNGTTLGFPHEAGFGAAVTTNPDSPLNVNRSSTGIVDPSAASVTPSTLSTGTAVIASTLSTGTPVDTSTSSSDTPVKASTLSSDVGKSAGALQTGSRASNADLDSILLKRIAASVR